MYVSDPSSIAMRWLPDPVTEADLRLWVNDLANAGADIFVQEAYTQGWTTYWRTDRYDYDARPQHERFLPLLDASLQPLQILLEQSHERGIEFAAGMRVNDNHGHISVAQGVGAGSSFLTDNPQWQIRADEGALGTGTFLDFTHAEVRAHIAGIADHLLETFDLDGLELCFRDEAYFPAGTERDRQPLMTAFIRSVREILERAGERRGRQLVLGARVYATLELCGSQGLDVAAWVGEGLIDWVAPSDTMYMAINEPIDEFGKLTEGTGCMLYPAIMPHSSARRISWLDSQPLNLEQKRAAAQNFYAAGADGLSYYNHMWAIEWPPFYPMALHEMGELGDPKRVTRGNRHYIFEPMLDGQRIWGNGIEPVARPQPERITLRRTLSKDSGRFRFRICEQVSKVRHASLLFRAYGMTRNDRVEVLLNGHRIRPPALRLCSAGEPVAAPATNLTDYEKRIDMKGGTDKSTHVALGLSPIPDLPKSFATGWFQLTPAIASFGDNFLEVTLVSGDAEQSDDIVIEEVEVHVAP